VLVPLLTLSFASLTICDADTSTTRVRAKLFIGSGSPRAEGPPVNSPAREGGVFLIPLTRGPKARHCGCVAPSALHLDGRPIPGLTAGLFTGGPSGLNCYSPSKLGYRKNASTEWLELTPRECHWIAATIFKLSSSPNSLSDRAVRRTGRALLQGKLQREALFALGCVSLNRWTRTAWSWMGYFHPHQKRQQAAALQRAQWYQTPPVVTIGSMSRSNV